MAALDKYSTLVVLLLGMILIGFAIPTSKALTLDESKNHYNPWCGQEIDGFIFRNGTVTDSCCEDLMSLGKPCHEHFVSQTQATLHPNITLASVASKSTRVWNKCFAITRSQIAETKTVEDCELKFNPQCGQEITNFIFNNGNNVTQSCCLQFLLLGRE
ncbi:hypothetical protein M0R45_025245 [Rubus argutus]|uniref:Prolamin-like domain-containing protein n=1 Tax=Rubus argutus TaxID=59490 RepID=A0AAW1WUX2_RUBAR